MKTVARALLAAVTASFAGGCAPAPIAPGNYSVDVEFTVQPDGRTTDAKVIRSNAPASLQKEALAEVSRYRAEPAAQATKGRRTVEFSVGDPAARQQDP